MASDVPVRYVDKVWSLRYTILLLVVMQAFDTLSTILALGVGGGEEANPLMAEALVAAGGSGSSSPSGPSWHSSSWPSRWIRSRSPT